jgi:hypothetical protein
LKTKEKYYTSKHRNGSEIFSREKPEAMERAQEPFLERTLGFSSTPVDAVFSEDCVRRYEQAAGAR